MRTHSLADLSGALRDFADWLDGKGLPKLDRFFWHKVRMARFGPDIHFAPNREVDEPYRTGKVMVLHLEPFKTGIALGWYARPTVDLYDDNAISEHVRRAMTVRTPSRKEIDEFDDERKLHGPGRPVGLRFSATRGGTLRRGPQRRVVIDGDAGPDEVRIDDVDSTYWQPGQAEEGLVSGD